MHEYLAALRFIVADAGRDPSFSTNHLMSYLAQDFIESAVAVTFLGGQGALNVAKRELRFILESSVKMCFVQQQSYASTIEEKLARFDRHLTSPSISIKRDLNIGMLPSESKEPFNEEIGRLYGETSGYVHLTTKQIMERIAAVDQGRTVGHTSADEEAKFAVLVSRSYAASLVLLLHSVPDYVAGDWLVDSDGSTVESYFLGSKFVAGIDAHFDYKHERQSRLPLITAERASRVLF
ncbi:MAG: hypothetical protein ACM336_21235 [Acidobacteriota bacterium]